MSITDKELAEWRAEAREVRRVRPSSSLSNAVDRLLAELYRLRAQAAWRPDREEIEREIVAFFNSEATIEEAADAILALSPPPQEPQATWRPIESAPRDGTHVVCAKWSPWSKQWLFWVDYWRVYHDSIGGEGFSRGTALAYWVPMPPDAPDGAASRHTGQLRDEQP